LVWLLLLQWRRRQERVDAGRVGGLGSGGGDVVVGQRKRGWWWLVCLFVVVVLGVVGVVVFLCTEDLGLGVGLVDRWTIVNVVVFVVEVVFVVFVFRCRKALMVVKRGGVVS